MSIKPDHWIRHMVLQECMIDPFEPTQVRGPMISYGLSSYGYDIRLADEFKFFTGRTAVTPTAEDRRPTERSEDSTLRQATRGDPSLEVLDPKLMSVSDFADFEGNTFDLAPASFVLGRSVEYFRIPHDVLTLCVGKSSYARCGVLVNVTPFEPGWEGHATLCIANVGSWPVRLHAGEGIAQVLFFQSDEPCEVTYADKQGKYQAQRAVTPARLG
jgi:dCTP deaminase